MTAITIDRALLEQALEALENAQHKSWKTLVFMQSIRAELAKPVMQANPVAWLHDQRRCGAIHDVVKELWLKALPEKVKHYTIPLYLHQPTPTWQDAPEVAALKAERDELLAALKELLSELEYGHACPLTKEKSRAAIAKAEGRTE